MLPWGSPLGHGMAFGTHELFAGEQIEVLRVLPKPTLQNTLGCTPLFVSRDCVTPSQVWLGSGLGLCV